MRPLLPLLLLASACVPYSNPPLVEIPNLGSLREVMDAQSTISDPLWSHVEESSIGERDWPMLRDASTRLEATAERSKAFDKSFDKSTRFDELADRLETGAAALTMSVQEKDASRASLVITEMRATCDQCHKEFR